MLGPQSPNCPEKERAALHGDFTPERRAIYLIVCLRFSVVSSHYGPKKEPAELPLTVPESDEEEAEAFCCVGFCFGLDKGDSKA